jgi:hypothetical protein
MDSFVGASDQYKSSIEFAVNKMVQYKADGRASPGFSKSLSELIWQLTNKVVPRDLVAFMQHGKRSSPNEDDVILISRNCPKIYQHLIEIKEKDTELHPKTKKQVKKGSI